MFTHSSNTSGFKESKNQEAAKKFLSFLYSDKAAEIFAKYNAAQPIKV